MDEAEQGLIERSAAVTAWIEEYLGTGPIRGAEVGVFLGRMSHNLLARHENLHLFMVDKWEPIAADSTAGKSGDELVHLRPHYWYMVYGVAVANTAFAADRRTIIRKDSTLAAEDVPDGSLGFVFIDADHSYEGCMADLKAWAPKVSGDGFVSGHDIDSPDYPRWGVRKALEDFGIGIPILGMNYTWCFPKKWLEK